MTARKWQKANPGKSFATYLERLPAGGCDELQSALSDRRIRRGLPGEQARQARAAAAGRVDYRKRPAGGGDAVRARLQRRRELDSGSDGYRDDSTADPGADTTAGADTAAGDGAGRHGAAN